MAAPVLALSGIGVFFYVQKPGRLI